jgi:hypothetical protein
MPGTVEPTNGCEPILSEALKLFDAGFAVVVCSGKKPRWRDWQTVRRNREELTRALHGGNCNIGLVLNLSELIDVECDSPQAETNLAAMFGGKIPATCTWRSKRGLHRLFERPADLPPKALVKIDGIEIRIGNGRGAMSIVPPSRHPDGGTLYEWLPKLSIHEVEPASLPESITERLRGPASPQAAHESDAAAQDKVTKGKRNDHLFRLACKLRRDGYDDERVYFFTATENETRCDPPVEVDEVATLVNSALRKVEKDEADSFPYVIRGGRITLESKNRDGTPVFKPLSNFSAQIVEQVVKDDGVERQLTFSLEGQLAGGPVLPRVEVSGAEFGGMNWVTRAWGSRAIVFAGSGTRDHLRAGIQVLSGDVPERTVFEHCGWRKLDDQWLYLHSGGAIGGEGAVDTVEVSLPGALALYQLPKPPTGEERREAVRASLAIMDVGPDNVMAPLGGMAYRAVLGSTDFSGQEVGPTGCGKTELAALVQQHFGRGMDGRHLPGSWSSTANSLEVLAFHLKDAVFVVDDFAPHGSATDIARQHKDADRLLRAQGNHSGRGRCYADGSVRPPKPPRGLVLSTGEDVPAGESLRARLCIVELAPNDVDWAKLTDAQRDGASGRFALAMSGYLHWLAPRMDTIRQELPQKTAALREQLRADGQHARTPGITADLLFGWQTFTRFAVDVGAVTTRGRDLLLVRIRKALLAAAARQAGHLESVEPTAHFLRLLGAALASCRVHVARDTGGIPSGPSACWGWQTIEGTARPGGRKVGWLKDKDLYLEPDASYAAAQELARQQGEALTVSAQTLRKRLHEKGILVSTWPGKLTVAPTLEGQRRSVLHLHAASVVGVGG